MEKTKKVNCYKRQLHKQLLKFQAGVVHYFLVVGRNVSRNF